MNWTSRRQSASIFIMKLWDTLRSSGPLTDWLCWCSGKTNRELWVETNCIFGHWYIIYCRSCNHNSKSRHDNILNPLGHFIMISMIWAVDCGGVTGEEVVEKGWLAVVRMMTVGEWSLVHWLEWSGVAWSSVCDQTPAGQHHDLTAPCTSQPASHVTSGADIALSPHQLLRWGSRIVIGNVRQGRESFYMGFVISLYSK